jgi:hypothetical protein
MEGGGVVVRAMIAAGWVLILSATVFAENQDRPASLEIRAAQAFSSGEYEVALPMLEKLAERYATQPERLGPIEEQIRVARRNLAKATGKPATAEAEEGDTQAASSERPEGGDATAVPQTDEQRKAHPAPKEGEVRELTITELGNFEYDADNGGNIPDDVKGLSGSAIRVRGFMIPMDQADRITQFALVPDLFACCFGQPPQIHHTIVVGTPQGKAVSYFDDEIVVEGVLKVEEKWEDEWIVSVFEMEAASVKPAPR